MENAKISNLYDLDETIAKEYLEQFTYPWEALKGISEFIKKLGPTLDPEKFEKRGEDIWVAKSAKVAPTACLNGPLIIDENAEIRDDRLCEYGQSVVTRSDCFQHIRQRDKRHCHPDDLDDGEVSRIFDNGFVILYFLEDRK